MPRVALVRDDAEHAEQRRRQIGVDLDQALVAALVPVVGTPRLALHELDAEVLAGELDQRRGPPPRLGQCRVHHGPELVRGDLHLRPAPAHAAGGRPRRGLALSAEARTRAASIFSAARHVVELARGLLTASSRSPDSRRRNASTATSCFRAPPLGLRLAAHPLQQHARLGQQIGKRARLALRGLLFPFRRAVVRVDVRFVVAADHLRTSRT